MAAEQNEILDFTEGLIKGRLDYVSSYLGGCFPGVRFGLVDAQGKNNLFWLGEGSCFVIVEDAGSIPDLHDQSSIYDGSSKSFFYKIGQNDISFYIHAFSVSDGSQADAIRLCIEKIKPSIQQYLNLYSLANENVSSLIMPFYTHFFNGRSFDAQGFFAVTHEYLDPMKKHFVIVREFSPKNTYSPQQLTSIAHTQVKDKSSRIFEFIYGNRSLMILSVDNEYDVGDRRSYANASHIAHERTRRATGFGYEVFAGVGRPKPVNNLFDSYKEACCALAFGVLEGRDNFTLAFDDLNGLEPFLMQSPREMFDYSTKILKPLLVVDQKESGDQLLETLRVFFRCNLQFKEAASQLFVHPNTLRYRISKAFDLIGRDSDAIYDRFVVYVAIKVWDILEYCKFFDLGEEFRDIYNMR